MNWNAPFGILLLALSLCLGSCRNKTAGAPVGMGQMEELLYDYQLLQATSNQMTDSVGVRKKLLMEAFLKKHKLTQANFDSALSWYAKHPEEFAKVYAAVEKRFSMPRSGATDVLQKTGDTTANPVKEATPRTRTQVKNYWQGPSSYLLTMNGRRAIAFTQSPDPSLQVGDMLVWRASTTWIYREGLKSASFVLSLVYDNDSVAHRTMLVSTTGGQTLTIPIERKVKAIRGFIQQNGRADEGVKLLYVNNIALEVEKGVATTIDDAAQRKADSIANRERLEQRIQDSLLRPSKEPHFR